MHQQMQQAKESSASQNQVIPIKDLNRLRISFFGTSSQFHILLVFRHQKISYKIGYNTNIHNRSIYEDCRELIIILRGKKFDRSQISNGIIIRY